MIDLRTRLDALSDDDRLVQDAARDCPRGCLHSATEPECALDQAVAAGTVPVERLVSFRRILASMNTKDDY